MANSTSGRTWSLDTVGVLANDPVVIQKIIYIPSAAGNTLTFTQYDLTNTVAAGCAGGKTGTINPNTTLTSTGNLPSSIAVGYVFDIVASSGSANNVSLDIPGGTKRRYRVATAGSGDAVVVEAKWTTESTKVYSWKTYPTETAIALKAGASDASPITVDFGPKGRWFPNLILDTISAGTANIYIL